MSVGPHRCYELATAWLPNYFAILHHRLPSQYRADGHAFNFTAMVRSPADFRVSRFVTDDRFLIHIDDDHIDEDVG